MTRDSIPRDDLYGELEVSRQASVAAIEAAYRRLVKQHHPDVARSDDIERIKRLNLAREWLTDLDRRRRYDVSRGMSPTSAIAHQSPNDDDTSPGTRRRPRASSSPASDASSEPARSFGVNANEVRIFLASLRGLDSERARRVFDGRAVAHAKGYASARRAAAHIGQTKRKSEWQLAREAASVIARGKLGDTTLTEQVVDVLADTAGAIAIRDLLSRHDFNVVMLPWTWTSARVEPAPDAAPGAGAPASAPRPVARSARTPPPPVGRPTKAQPVESMLAGAAPAGVPAERWAEAFGTRWPPPRESVTHPAKVAPVASEPAPAPSVAAKPADVPAASFVAASTASVTPATRAPIRAGAAVPSTTEPAAGAPRPVVDPRPVARAAGPATPRISIAELGASPWTPPIEPERKPVKAEATPRAYRRATARLAVRRPSWIPAAAMLLGIVAVGAVVAALSRPPSELDVAAITDDPLTPTNEATGFVVVPVESDAPTTEPAATDLDAMPDPLVTDRPGGGPTPAPPPGPGATPKPTSAPTPAPTPTPPPAPTPTPPPPTPGPTCLVPNFINTQTTKALQKWTGSGFTGPMTIEPAPPPNYQIGWQSLAAGTMEPCTSGITVRDAAP